ncbi:MAG TPA: bL35 family ribosomal protein [Patescibacteria group bacterium]|nr:bL35 family ribosomal protein [Patescibacteria group bacterium]
MPKLKNHSGTKDRISITKNGKVLARKSYGNHFLEKKSMARKRTYSGLRELSGKTKRNVKRKIGA